MPRAALDALPDDARLWVFGAERVLDPGEQAELLSAVDRFLDEWHAHGSLLTAARDLREGRFLMVAVDERSVPTSGCSIDAMVGVLKTLEGRIGALVAHGPVYYRDPSGEVRRAERAEFGRLAGAGAVDPDTVVFDTTVTRVGRLRDGGWERPARDTWHGQAFFRRSRATDRDRPESS